MWLVHEEFVWQVEESQENDTLQDHNLDGAPLLHMDLLQLKDIEDAIHEVCKEEDHGQARLIGLQLRVFGLEFDAHVVCDRRCILLRLIIELVELYLDHAISIPLHWDFRHLDDITERFLLFDSELSKTIFLIISFTSILQVRASSHLNDIIFGN